MRVARLGQGVLATASAILAIWILTYGDFAWGEQPWLAKIPLREAWVYATALILLAASAGLCFPRTALPSVLAIGAYEAVGVVISVPQVLSHPLSVGAAYPFFEAVTPLAGAWVLYAMLRRQSPGSGMSIASDGAVRAARVLFGLSCVFYGWSHFVYADYTASMVPAWLPGHLALAYFTGVGHAAAGLAIIVGLFPRLAATLEAIMMSLFGLLVWVPSFFMQPRPSWASQPEHQWGELVVNVVLAASAWIVAISFGNHSSTFAARSRA